MKHLLKAQFLLIFALLVSACSRKEQIFLVKRGKIRHTIYLDTSVPGSVKTAAEDLQSYFIKVTGASPEIVISDQPPSPPFISLGNTAAAKEAGLDTYDIPIDGFRIVTMEENVFILGPDTPDGQVNSRGGENTGTSNGIYTFIEDYLGVKWLMPGEIGEEYNETKTIGIPALDTMEYSPFDYRVLSVRDRGEMESQWDRRLKLGMVSAVEHNHSWIETVPPALYDKHPEWFAMKDGKRIPPIGKYYKLETTSQEMVKYFAGKVIEAFSREPDRKWYSLSPSDGSGYSESPESLALTDKDPDGNLSVSPLIYKFYNDVARIVANEFPDRMLGGYIYGAYHYPPEFCLERNIAVMLPTSTVSGFVLYRPSHRSWATQVWVPEWSELSKKCGFDLYYYCFPTWTPLPNGLVTPPAPDILNIVFSDMIKYGFKGIYFYGNPIWPAFGPGNYAIAKMFWDPEQDAHQILRDYYRDAYGEKALPHIEKFHHVLDTAYSNFMNRNLKAKWVFTEDNLEQIYGPNYTVLEKNFLEALAAKKKPKQQQRLELLGNVLSLLQFNLRDYGYLPENYISPLTLGVEEIDGLIKNQDDECRITRPLRSGSGDIDVELMPALADAKSNKASLVPVNRGIQVLIHALTDGEISITVEALNRRAEFTQYFLTGSKGQELLTGVVFEGRTIRFDGQEGLNYFLNIPSRGGSARLRIDNASVAYNIPSRGMQLEGEYITEETFPLYFYVPEGVDDFSITLGNMGVVADVYSPDGSNFGRLDNTNSPASYILVKGNKVREGFWKIEFMKLKRRALITLDEKLPQWLISDPAHPLKIL